MCVGDGCGELGFLFDVCLWIEKEGREGEGEGQGMLVGQERIYVRVEKRWWFG